MSIFLENAPLYWAAGLPVMPLKKWDSISKGAGKAPILSEWTQYGERMPSEAMRNTWLRSYPESNIGLPFGSASGLCAIDIDTEDKALIDAILGALPKSPWVRVGKKGMGLIYRWSGQNNFKLRNSENESIVEFLGKGNQMVMPPSIHPDTKKAYVANVNLWDVMDVIPSLPDDLEGALRRALGGIEGLSIAQTGRSAPLTVVPAGERDIQLVRHAGYLARVVLGIDKNEKAWSLVKAMDHIYTWVEDFTAGKAGDDMDPEKGVSKLIEFLLKDVESGRTLPNGWDTGLTDEQREHPGIAAMIEKNQVQRWDVMKAQDWIDAEMFQDPDNKRLFYGKMDELISLVAADENFELLHMKQLAEHLKKVAKKVDINVSKPDLVSAFKDMRTGSQEMAGDHEAIAREVLEEMSRGGEIKYDQSSFWQWEGSHFKRQEETDMYRKVAETVKGNTLAKRHNDYVSIVKCMSNICRESLAVELEHGINFANGFLDVNLELHEHSPKYGKTFTMPFNYIPERAGECHKWLEYLERSWGDDEDYADKVAALQEAFAATMFGMAPQFQRCFLLHGKAGTGKSQALEVLRALMPEDGVSSVSPAHWAERFQLTPMVGKALNVCGELPEEAVINGRVFKEVVEGTIQTTEFKGTALFDFKPIAAHWFAGNFLPRSRDTSGGFVRRWQVFDFNRVVPLEEKVVNFHEVLIAEEREAIAAWAMLGLKRLMQQKDYTQPASHRARLDQITRANNSVAAFLATSDKVRPSKGSRADLRNVFDVYVDHMRCISRGWSVTLERFIQMLEEVGHKCVPYIDGVGAQRHEVIDLELKTVILPGRLPG